MTPPTRKAGSDPVRLIPGEVAGLRLSRPERRLLKYAHDTFGEPLSRFLLSGLGEEGEARRWLFVITFTGEGGDVLRRRLYVEADELAPEIMTSLPRGREPLVILALLRLRVRGHKPPPASLFYDQEEVLKLLGWEDTAESRLRIDEAIDRYTYLAYRWALSRKELSARNLSFYRSRERFVSGYGYHDVEEEEGRMKRVSNRVDFNAAFLKELMNRSLFQVDWNGIQSLSIKSI